MLRIHRDSIGRYQHKRNATHSQTPRDRRAARSRGRVRRRYRRLARGRPASSRWWIARAVGCGSGRCPMAPPPPSQRPCSAPCTPYVRASIPSAGTMAASSPNTDSLTRGSTTTVTLRCDTWHGSAVATKTSMVGSVSTSLRAATLASSPMHRSSRSKTSSSGIHGNGWASPHTRKRVRAILQTRCTS